MIEVNGKIWFDPKNVTKKHNIQSDWKRMAMVIFDCDMTEYYSWFIQKRYNLQLNRPLRGTHISFKWDEVKEKYNGTEVKLILDTNVKSDSKHWWLPVDYGSRQPLLDIRSELGLGKPYWGMHMTIGYCNPKNEEHSKYIHGLITKFSGGYN